MLGFSRMEIIRKLILLITGILIALRCFFPGHWDPGFPGLELLRGFEYTPTQFEIWNNTLAIERMVGIGLTGLQCIGIAVIGGVLFYILGGKKQRKD